MHVTQLLSNCLRSKASLHRFTTTRTQGYKSVIICDEEVQGPQNPFPEPRYPLAHLETTYKPGVREPTRLDSISLSDDKPELESQVGRGR